MNKVKDMEIPILFHNYKLLKDKEFVLKGSHIYFIQGPNETGKTSFLTALQGAMTAKDVTNKKVSVNEEGEDSGFYEFTIPAADGSMVTIRNEFTDQKNKFTAIKEDGEKVSSVGEIRKLFNYTAINVNEFFTMSRTADGRRRQKDIILKLLPDDLREKFVDLDLQEQHHFTKRTETGRSMDTAKGYVASVIISEDDVKLLSKEEAANALMEKYQGFILSRKTTESIISSIDQLNSEKVRINARLIEIDKELEKFKKELGEEEPEDISELTTEDLELKVSNGKEVIRKITEIRAKQTLKDESSEKLTKLEKDYEGYTVNIDQLRMNKTQIVSGADLPVNDISFEDEYLTIDGFRFDENQVCESDAVLLLANILAKINPGPVQVIGDASILDAKKLEELNKIAESNNKVMFVDEVVRTSDKMVVVGYEQAVGKPKTSKTPNLDKIEAKTAKPKETKKTNIKPDTSTDKGEAPLF